MALLGPNTNPSALIGQHKTFIISLFIVILLFGWFFLFAAEKINLVTADLGRHIKNGEIILSSLQNPAQRQAILHTNFYSYTQPDHPFINHHWGSGIIFYLIWKNFGFTTISLFYLLLGFVSFLLVFDVTRKISGFQPAIILSFFTIPLAASRAEIRPEVFSYLFISFFFWILWHFSRDRISKKPLITLPIIMLLWANLHIYFCIGLALIGIFLFEQLIIFLKEKKKEKFYAISLILGLSTCFSAISPFGIKGLTYPLKIFDKYGYLLVENQPVWFLQKLGFSDSSFTLFKIALVFLLAVFLLATYMEPRKIKPIYLLLMAGATLMACLSIRNFPVFALLMLPVMGYNISILFKKMNFRPETLTTVFVAIIVLTANLMIYKAEFELLKKTGGIGVGLLPENNRAIEFIKENNIKGPIFNNYDLGGFLIFGLFPGEKVFVDNRPEAYSVDFFQEKYIPMQQNGTVWQEQDAKYNFNIIVFAWHDQTPWGQDFIIRRVKDNDWAPVFADKHVLVLLKRNTANQKIIEEYEIPQERFTTIENS